MPQQDRDMGHVQEPGIACNQGGREYMEDRSVVAKIPGGMLFAVFDGHGGSVVADHACAAVVTSSTAAVGDWASPESFWRSVFSRLDLDVTGCGSTATTIIRRSDELSLAWVGDSRALLLRPSDYAVLTRAHRTDRDDERRRVLSAGGNLRGRYVVDPLTLRGLMITRSLGDRDLRRIGVISEPEIVTVDMTSNVKGHGDARIGGRSPPVLAVSFHGGCSSHRKRRSL